jgi:hypothetical protein
MGSSAKKLTPVRAEGANAGAQPRLKAAATSGAEAVGRRLQWLVITRNPKDAADQQKASDKKN